MSQNAPPALTDLADFRLIRALRGAHPGAFPSLWNAFAGDTWSVFRALVGSDREALAWCLSFRLDLQEDAARFVPSEPLAPQVGKALLGHAQKAFPDEAPMPAGPLPSDERGVAALPSAVRLRYLVGLFFDTPEEAAAARLLEPALDTDAHQLVLTALLRSPPAAALLLPPGSERPRRTWIGPVVVAIALLTAGAIGWSLRSRSWDPLVSHDVAFEGLQGVLLSADPVDLSIKLAQAGAPSLLTEVPDLSPSGLSLLGAQIGDDAVVLLYRGADGDWTLQHVEAARLPDGEPVARRGDVGAWMRDGRAVAAWREGTATWLLVANVPAERALDVADTLVTHRRSAVPPARSIFDALSSGGGSK